MNRYINRYIDQHITFQNWKQNRWGRRVLIVAFPVLFLYFFLFTPGWWGSQRFPMPIGLEGTAGWYLGLPIAASGMALYLWTLLLFAKAQGTQVPVAPTQNVVTSGPYAHVQHTLYLGSFLISVCGIIAAG